ncbi:hypothetical protein GCM10008955_42430 [Deinococcus malanensis]|uniref:Transposase n=1 Tax=Deinococcus malanensis TaxID=1706855 RepID=A0ABQ2F3E7_9DEIO|nr:hypothetical protein GCM10008955_42430 [Deinococcus malanensis]
MDWAPIDQAYRLVSQAAQVLDNAEDGCAERVKVHFSRVMDRMRTLADQPNQLQGALRHFLKVTDSYGPALFHTYRLADIPRTNNDLEQWFGAARYHERRVTGRKAASPSTVIRGQVRLIAAFGSRQQPPAPAGLMPRCVVAWQTLRSELDGRHERRRKQLRFRRDPEPYLLDLEERLVKLPLPS